MLCEIKYSQSPTISKGFYSCVEDLGTQKNFVVTPGSGNFYDGNRGVRLVGLKPFVDQYILPLKK